MTEHTNQSTSWEVKPETPEEPLDIPQLMESGYSADYRNNYLSFAILCRKFGERFPDAFAKSGIRSGPIPKYLELYPPEHFRNAINDHNRETLAHLDALVDAMNTMLLEPTAMDANHFLDLCDEADRLILGAEEHAAAA